MARLKKTLPSRPPEAGDIPPALSQDPSDVPSLSSRIMDGIEKLPAGGLFAKDAVGDEIYANFEKTNRMCRIIPNAELLEKEKQVELTFYSGPHHGWLTVKVASVYPLIPAEHPNAPRILREVEKTQEERKARAAHLPKFKKVKPDPEPSPSHGKHVFKGKLNGKNVLFDAGDGATVAVLEPGLSLPEEAKKLKREYVSQGKATPYAIFVFTKQWQAQK